MSEPKNYRNTTSILKSCYDCDNMRRHPSIKGQLFCTHYGYNVDMEHICDEYYPEEG